MTLQTRLRCINDKDVLLVFHTNGRKPTAQELEDAGEDFGFYEPKFEAAEGELRNAFHVTESFQGQLCHHRWEGVTHFSRNPFGYIRTCGKCGVRTIESYRKRARTGEFTYDVWSLREHIWKRWMKRGPVPGSLTVQEHHK